MAVPLHGLEQDRQQRPQPFATDPVGCLPNHDQCLAHSLIVNPATGPRSANPVHLPSPQQTHRMLAVIAGYRRKLVQNPTPLVPISPRIPVCYAATNSSRPPMLIRLIISPADENRSGANQMRQHLSFREHFRRGNALPSDDLFGEIALDSLPPPARGEG